jgi:high-affinity Fe2+/Pb2+ permease
VEGSSWHFLNFLDDKDSLIDFAMVNLIVANIKVISETVIFNLKHETSGLSYLTFLVLIGTLLLRKGRSNGHFVNDIDSVLVLVCCFVGKGQISKENDLGSRAGLYQLCLTTASL